MRGEVDPADARRSRARAFICASAARRPRAAWSVPSPTGQNLVWSAYTHLCLAPAEERRGDARRRARRDGVRRAAGVRAKASSAIARSISTARSSTPAATAAQFANDVARYALITARHVVRAAVRCARVVQRLRRRRHRLVAARRLLRRLGDQPRGRASDDDRLQRHGRAGAGRAVRESRARRRSAPPPRRCCRRGAAR